jgi:hypothetical protein
VESLSSLPWNTHYVIQDRLKRAGAWWKLKNAKHMLALRVCRANQEWDRYWQSRRQQAA